MIICFSGTGNSLLVARELQRHLGGALLELEGERLLNPAGTVVELEGSREHPADDAPRRVEDVVWVFPVYSWGVPPVVERYIRKVKMKGGYEARHFMVCTCGDDVGRTDRQWSSLMGKRGWHPRAAYSVEMPNTYVLMKGFDVDSPDVEARKLTAMPERVARIAEGIKRGSEVADVVRGKSAFFKSAMIYPLFKRLFMSPAGFHTSPGCTSCGLCSRSCPMENITMDNGRPRWGGQCALCLRCYHICPAHAVEYDRATCGKGTKKVFR